MTLVAELILVNNHVLIIIRQTLELTSLDILCDRFPLKSHRYKHGQKYQKEENII